MLGDDSFMFFLIIVFLVMPVCGILFYLYILWKYKKEKKKYQGNMKVATVVLIVSIAFLIVTMPRTLTAAKILIDLLS